MKKTVIIALSALFLSATFTSCRDKKDEMTKEEKVVQEMKDDGADIKVKDDGDKIKMETEEKSVKIKTDDDGDTKIKTDMKDDN